MSVTPPVGSEAAGVGRERGSPASPEHSERSRSRFVPVLGAGVVAVLYFAFLLHFAVDAPTADEWANIGIIDAATHGHLSFGLFWAQYFQSRMLFPNLLFVFVGIPTHYDSRWFVAISASCYIASFFLILAAVRRYLDRDLQTLPTVFLALVWFSLAAVFDALWAFELGYYLVILALALVLFCLLVPQRRRPLWFALAVVAAVVGSYSFVQGLALWPAGLVLILFRVPRTRRTMAEVGVWVGTGAVTLVLYLWNFDLAGTNSLCVAHCGVGYTLSHPGLTLSYWLRMVGNIIPSVSGGTGVVQIILGVTLTGAAMFVLVQSVRERHRKPMVALPLGMVVFALVWDMMIVSARVSLGDPGFDEYTLAQVVLLAGITIFAWDHAYEYKSQFDSMVVLFRRLVLADARPATRGTWSFALFALVGLSLLLLIQVLASSQFGWDEAESVSSNRQLTAQLAVNLAEVPKDLQSCYLGLVIGAGLDKRSELASTRAMIDLAARDTLGMFGPAVVQQFRAEGPPKLPRLDRAICLNEISGRRR